MGEMGRSATNGPSGGAAGAAVARASDAARQAQCRATADFEQLTPAELAQAQARADEIAATEGMTYRVTGEEEPRIFPTDPIPRVIDADTWAMLSDGLEQRARALNAFLDDVYGPQRIIEAGVVDAADVEIAPGYLAEGRLQPPGGVRAHICGMDLVCNDAGEWLVLEDNLRVPSGLVFSYFLRQMTSASFEELLEKHEVRHTEEGFAMLRETLLAAAPQHATDLHRPRMALVSTGPSDSAWFEHSRIAEFVGMPVCTPDQLAVEDGRLRLRDSSGATTPLDVVYARIGKEQLFEADGYDGQPLGPGLEDALASRRLVFANAFGNGVGDDKAIYAYVPQMIRFYLEEEPLLAQVPTIQCHRPGALDEVIPRLHEMVIKPVDGYGGSGITIGPECTPEELEVRAQQLRENPEHYIAQEIVHLSTLPTFGPDEAGETCVHPRHVDLRAFVHVRPAPHADGTQEDGAPEDRIQEERTHEEGAAKEGTAVSAHALSAHTLPVAFTRTAPAGSLIVNTSRGGGGKDTWILGSGEQPAEPAA